MARKTSENNDVPGGDEGPERKPQLEKNHRDSPIRTVTAGITSSPATGELPPCCDDAVVPVREMIDFSCSGETGMSKVLAPEP
jgi:hypothetical protein